MAGPLMIFCTVCYAAGTILMLAMAFGVLPHGWALFLGTSCFVVGGLAHGLAQPARGIDPAARPDFPPTVSRREEH